MIKLVTLHAPGIAAAETRKIVDRAEVRALICATALDTLIPGIGSMPFDGVVESTWFDDEQSAAGALELAGPHAVPAANRILATENFVVGDPARHILPDAIKVMAFIRRRPDLDVATFQRYWRTEHAALVRKLPRLSRYVQTHLTPSNYDSGREPPFDGIAELWWPDAAAFESAWLSDEMAEDAADGANYSGSGAYIFVAQDRQLV